MFRTPRKSSHPHLSPAFLLSAVLSAVTLLCGCGDTFRPVATPIIQPGGDPANLRNAIILSANGASPGSTNHVDVSGDTIVAVHTVGANPVHASFTNSSGRIFIANHDDNSLTSYATFGGSVATNTTITLPPGSCPSFVHSREAANVYVANSNVGAACGGAGAGGSVGVVSAGSLALTASIPVGNNPVALVEMPNGQKVYVVNQDDNTVTSINTIDKTVAAPAIPLGGMHPVAIDASSDNACIYVANRDSNNVSVISTATDAVTNIAVGAGPTFLRFDARLQRVYVANTAGDSVSIIHHLPNCDQSTSTATTVPLGAGTQPVSIAPLADGTRVYVANSGNSTVSMISTSSNTVNVAPIVLPAVAGLAAVPVSIAASGDSTKVFTANSGNQSFSVIRTSDNTVSLNSKTASPTPTFVLITP